MTVKLSKSDLGKFSQLLQFDQHKVIADARIALESDSGPDPHDLYDAALAACKAITLMMYAERANIPLDNVEISVYRDSSEERSGKYTLQVHMLLHGNLDLSQQSRLENIAAKCPIHRLMTTGTTTIITSIKALGVGSPS